MIKDWLDSYKPKNKAEALQALREIMQETTLPGCIGQDFLRKLPFMAERHCGYFTA